MKYALLAVLLVGCIDSIDPRWQLDHDHVIAARATPPRIRSGDATNLDALVAHADGPVTIENPASAAVATRGFAPFLSQGGDGTWRFDAPTSDVLTTARSGLGLADGDPVPVEVELTFPHPGGLDRAALDPFRVKKTVWLGEPSTNPDLPAATIDGQPAPTDEIVLPLDRDVYVSLAAPADARVNWLTNVGTLFQDDVATAYIHVKPSDRLTGQLVAVLRDRDGGVAWQVWSVRAE